MILTIPRHIARVLLDAVFGKAEPFHFTGSTLPVDKLSTRSHDDQ